MICWEGGEDNIIQIENTNKNHIFDEVFIIIISNGNLYTDQETWSVRFTHGEKFSFGRDRFVVEIDVWGGGGGVVAHFH